MKRLMKFWILLACAGLALFASCKSDDDDDVAVESVTLSQTELTLAPGKTATLTATVLPEDADDKDVAWLSSNTAVATVDGNGKVTAVKAGSATVTASAGGKTATCTVIATGAFAIASLSCADGLLIRQLNAPPAEGNQLLISVNSSLVYCESDTMDTFFYPFVEQGEEYTVTFVWQTSPGDSTETVIVRQKIVAEAEGGLGEISVNWNPKFDTDAVKDSRLKLTNIKDLQIQSDDTMTEAVKNSVTENVWIQAGLCKGKNWDNFVWIDGKVFNAAEGLDWDLSEYKEQYNIASEPSGYFVEFVVGTAYEYAGVTYKYRLGVKDGCTMTMTLDGESAY